MARGRGGQRADGTAHWLGRSTAGSVSNPEVKERRVGLQPALRNSSGADTERSANKENTEDTHSLSHTHTFIQTHTHTHYFVSLRVLHWQ